MLCSAALRCAAQAAERRGEASRLEERRAGEERCRELEQQQQAAQAEAARQVARAKAAEDARDRAQVRGRGRAGMGRAGVDGCGPCAARVFLWRGWVPEPGHAEARLWQAAKAGVLACTWPSHGDQCGRGLLQKACRIGAALVLRL